MLICETCKIPQDFTEFRPKGRPPRNFQTTLNFTKVCKMCRDVANKRAFAEKCYQWSREDAIAAYGDKCKNCPETRNECLMFVSLTKKKRPTGLKYWKPVLDAKDSVPPLFLLLCKNCASKRQINQND